MVTRSSCGFGTGAREGGAEQGGSTLSSPFSPRYPGSSCRAKQRPTGTHYRRTWKFDGSFFLTGSLSIEPAAMERNVIEIRSWPIELVPTPLAAVTLAPYSANRAWRGREGGRVVGPRSARRSVNPQLTPNRGCSLTSAVTALVSAWTISSELSVASSFASTWSCSPSAFGASSSPSSSPPPSSAPSAPLLLASRQNCLRSLCALALLVPRCGIV